MRLTVDGQGQPRLDATHFRQGREPGVRPSGLAQRHRPVHVGQRLLTPPQPALGLRQLQQHACIVWIQRQAAIQRGQCLFVPPQLPPRQPDRLVT